MQTNIWAEEINPFQKFKILCHHDRMKRIRTGNFAAPVNIAIDLCQGTRDGKMCGGLKCNFCMSDLEDKGEMAHIPSPVLLALPQFFRDWGVLSVCLAGHHSDPFAYNHDVFIQFIRALYRNDVEAGINTNGFLLDEMMVPDITRNCKWTGFSVNAGRGDTFARATATTESHFEIIIQNIVKMTRHCIDYKIAHPVCYKFLITDDNYLEIYEAAKLAKEAGCRQIQIRPSELPECRSSKIDVGAVEEQLVKSLELCVPGKFGIYGIREKFTSDFKKKPPPRCIASPLGSTWKADGNVVICPDRRWSAHLPGMTLGNFITEGPEAIRRKWGGAEHRGMIAAANENIDKCIRCTAWQWHFLYETTVETDPMDLRLI